MKLLIFRRLLSFLRPYRKGVAWSFGLAAGAMVMTVLIPLLTGRGDQLDPQPSPPHADRLCDRDRRRRAAAARPERGAAAGRRAGVAGRRGRPAQPALRAVPAARARLLRPPADGTADVARDRRSPVGALLPRLRPDLHRPVAADDRAGRGGDVRAPAGAGRAGPGPRAVRRADRQPVRQALAPRAPGGPAADRRAHRRGRGERLGRARDQGVRPGGAPARAASAIRSSACSTSSSTRPRSRPATRR